MPGLNNANSVITTGVGKVDNGRGALILSSKITNLDRVNKIGSGTLWLTNTSDFVGTTAVFAGTLTLTGALTRLAVTEIAEALAGTGLGAGLVIGNGGKVSLGATDGASQKFDSTGRISVLTGLDLCR